MKSGSALSVMFQLFQALLFTVVACLALPDCASAVQWHDLAQTGRHSVALEMDSLRLNASGRLTVWLRFVPRGENQRREAARDYENRNYRMHLEFYEIDCSEKSAVLKLIDILGAGGKRLVRLPGGSQPETIIPDSVLDRAARRACPKVDDVAADTEEEMPESTNQAPAESADTAPLPEDIRQRIENALVLTKSEPAAKEAWVALGNAYYDADLPKKAIDAYDRALKLNPNDTNVLNDQGAMYRQLGNFTQALVNFEKALVIDPGNLESLYNLGYVHAIDLNHISKALEIWKRYLEKDSTSDTAQQVRSFITHFDKGQELR